MARVQSASSVGVACLIGTIVKLPSTRGEEHAELRMSAFLGKPQTGWAPANLH